MQKKHSDQSDQPTVPFTLDSKDLAAELRQVVEELSIAPADDNYAAKLLRIADLVEAGMSLAKAIYEVWGVYDEGGGLHAGYRAHVWMERIKNRGNLGTFEEESNE